MKANPDKCHLLTSSSDEVSISVDNYWIKSSKSENLLGIKIDNKLNARPKLNALSRVVHYNDLPKRRILLNALFISQFSCCS